MSDLPRFRVYVMHIDELDLLIKGTRRITNLPYGSKVYKVVPYDPHMCDNTIAVWFTGPEFDEVYPRSLVYIDCFQWEEVTKE